MNVNKDRELQICELAKILQWDGDISLLRQAMTHPTYFEGVKSIENKHNQRLEFLGDAVLGLVVGKELFKMYPDEAEGFLSKTRSSMVCEGALAELARGLDLYDCILMGKGSLRNGEQNRDSILSDAFEAMVGAMFLEMGMEKVEEFLLQLFTTAFAEANTSKYEDYKGLMQQLVQARGDAHLMYRTTGSSGPDHNRTFWVSLYYMDMVLAEASGRSKKEAEQNAAHKAWDSQEIWLKQV